MLPLESGSSGLVMTATFAAAPEAAGSTAATTVIVEFPTGRFVAVQVADAPAGAPGHDQAGEDIDTNDSPEGSVSIIDALDAVAGPLLVAMIV